MNSDIFGELTWRGLIHQVTDEVFLPGWLLSGSRTLYCGFDPTADSLHVGSLLPLLTLRRYQRAGHCPIAVVGGATGMIGDPSGKSEERNLLSVDALRANVAGLERQMRTFLDFDSHHNPARLVNNFDWISRFSYIDFLRDVGKNFPINVMLAKDSVKGRLARPDGGMSYTEFSYMLLQAYDFVHLYREFGCELQVGGSDQWGNITAGIDLARRMCGASLYGITCPLLTKSDGSKMGKTEAGTIWLSAARTSPYRFYQYWINVADEDAEKCLRMLTDLPREEIASLVQSGNVRAAQQRLAGELTRLVHGETGLSAAERATRVLFGEEITDLTDEQLAEVFVDVPSTELPRSLLEPGLSLLEALRHAGLAASNSEARRTIEQGGAYINNRRETRLDATLTVEQLAGRSVVVLRSGKKKYALLRFTAQKTP